jgi:hypothetical protein
MISPSSAMPADTSNPRENPTPSAWSVISFWAAAAWAAVSVTAWPAAAALPASEREVLLLVAWEQLTPAEAAGYLVQQYPGQLGVVIVERAGECLDQRGALGFHPAAGQAG